MTTEQSSLMEEPEKLFKRKTKDTKRKKKRRSTNVMKVLTNFFLCRGCKTQFNI